jgi:phage-related protein
VREIIFYKTENGNSPIEKFLDSLTAKQAKKVAWVLQIIEEIPLVPIQYFKKLEGTDDIWEVRIDSGSDTFRLLGFFDKGNLVILTNGFAKKTQKTPSAEITLAENRKKDWLERKR